MTKREIEAREKIVEAATALIREQGGTESITTRDIAARAGVGVGLINYHFQTKERLLDLCTQRLIGRIIGGFDALHQGMAGLEPMMKLRALLKETARFLVAHPGISRTSILHDLHSPGTGDNTVQTLQAYLPVVREVCGGQARDSEVRVLLHALISCMQSAFLRGGVFRQTSGFDMEDDAQRDQFVDITIDLIFHKYL